MKRVHMLNQMLIIFLTAAFLVCATGCSVQEAKSPVSAGESQPQPEKQAAEVYLDTVRQTLVQEGKTCAVAFLGSTSAGYEEVDQYLYHQGYLDAYPCLAGLPRERFAETWGQELYLIIPADPDASVTVYDWVMDEANDFQGTAGDLLLYSNDKGEPFVLKCNASDIMPDAVITIGSLEFSPALSLMDGSLLVPDAYVKDITQIIPIEKWRSASAESVQGCWNGYASDWQGTWYCYFEFQADGTAYYGYGSASEEGGVTSCFYEGTWSRKEMRQPGHPASGYELDMTISSAETDAPEALDTTLYISRQGERLRIRWVAGDALIPEFTEEELWVDYLSAYSVG